MLVFGGASLPEEDASSSELGGIVSSPGGDAMPEAADKIAVYRVKVFLFELF